MQHPYRKPGAKQRCAEEPQTGPDLLLQSDIVSGPQASRDVKRRKLVECCTPVEGDLLGLDLPVLYIHLVATQHNGNVFAHPAQPRTH